MQALDMHLQAQEHQGLLAIRIQERYGADLPRAPEEPVLLTAWSQAASRPPARREDTLPLTHLWYDSHRQLMRAPTRFSSVLSHTPGPYLYADC